MAVKPTIPPFPNININDYNLPEILNELSCWCMAWKGNINAVYNNELTLVEQVQHLFSVVNTTVESQVNLTDAFGTLTNEGFKKLYDFVNDYFTNLDLQEEVNNKLEGYLQDGTLLKLLNTIVTPYYQSLTQTLPTEVFETVADLTAKYPTGKNGAFVISALSEWWYWKRTTSGGSWVKGGDYIVSTPAENSITPSSLTECMLTCEKPVSFDLMQTFYPGSRSEYPSGCFSPSLSISEASTQSSGYTFRFSNNSFAKSNMYYKILIQSNNKDITINRIGTNIVAGWSTPAIDSQIISIKTIPSSGYFAEYIIKTGNLDNLQHKFLFIRLGSSSVAGQTLVISVFENAIYENPEDFTLAPSSQKDINLGLIRPLHIEQIQSFFPTNINTYNYQTLVASLIAKADSTSVDGYSLKMPPSTFKPNRDYMVIIRFDLVEPITIRNFYNNSVNAWGNATRPTVDSSKSSSYSITDSGIYTYYMKTSENLVSETDIYFLIQIEKLFAGQKIEISIYENLPTINTDKTSRNLAFIGDSMTAQGYWKYINYGNKYAFAVGGENTNMVFARTKIDTLWCNPVTINGETKLDLVSNGNSMNNLFIQGMGNINPVTISGITGNLSRKSDGVYFTPTDTSTNKAIRKSVVIPNMNLDFQTYIVWANNNNDSSPDLCIQNWNKVFTVYPNTLILGCHRKGFTNVNASNTAGENAFGGRFVNYKDWMINNGLQYLGITPTSKDTADIAAGEIPSSLMSDEVHFNDNGKRCIAHLVEERLLSLYPL